MPEAAGTGSRLSAKDVADAKIPGGLKAYLQRCREITDESERMTDVAIAKHMGDWFGIEVTDEAVRQWRHQEGVA